MVLASLFAALNAVCAWISLPVADIACTLQTFGIFLTLGLLGGKWGSASILIYLLLGAVGLPVFSGFQGGLGALLGVTGGFLWGFLLAGLCYRLLERFGKLPAMAAGMLCVYLCGSAWFTVYTGGKAGFLAALLRCVVPFLIPDALKIAAALALSRRIGRQVRLLK